MTPERNKELAELLPVHVMRLANRNMGLSLMDWNEISNDILDAARLLGAIAPPTDDEVQAINRRHEHCCYTVTNADWKEREAFQAHDDRATLLRHVDRLAAERSKADGAPELVEEIRSRNLHDWADSDDCEIISQFHDDVFKILRLLDAEQARRVDAEGALKRSVEQSRRLREDVKNEGDASDYRMGYFAGMEGAYEAALSLFLGAFKRDMLALADRLEREAGQ